MGDKHVQSTTEYSEEGTCGKPNVSPYGIHDAARNWEAKYVEVLRELVFVVGKLSPSLCGDEASDLRSVIHGGEIATIRDNVSLTRFEKAVGDRPEVKVRAHVGS